MNELIDYMDIKGFKTQSDIIDIVKSTDIDRLYLFIEELKEIINKQNQKLNEHSPFCYLASPEISGSGGCMERSCRLKRVDSFALYSALYSDKSYVTINCINNPHFFTWYPNKEYELKYDLTNDLLLINKLAQLIENDIVRIVKPEFMYCDDCIKQMLGDCTSNIDIDALVYHYLDIVDIELQCRKDRYVLNITNFEDFFEHGEIVAVLNVKKLNKNLKSKVDASPTKKYILTKQDILEYNILKSIISKEISGIRRNLLEAKTVGVKYLTSKIFDSHAMEFSTIRSENEDFIDVQQRIPIYDLPIISGTNIENILRIRELEANSFNRYRVALNQAAKERLNHNTKKELIEINDYIIYPALTELKSNISKIKEGRYKKFFDNILVLGSSISLGLTVGLTPSDPVKIMTALGGIPALIKAGSSLLNLNKEKEKIKDNDFYFLWRLHNKI